MSGAFPDVISLYSLNLWGRSQVSSNSRSGLERSSGSIGRDFSFWLFVGLVRELLKAQYADNLRNAPWEARTPDLEVNSLTL